MATIMQTMAPSPPQSSRDVLKPLRRRAVIAWVAAALSVGLLWGEHRLRVLHPLAMLFILLLVVSYAAAVGGLVRGLWRVFCGPWRVIALGWTGLSLVPGLLWPGLGWYGLHEWHRREVSRHLPNTLFKMAAASLMEAQARYLYPQRVETERLVMFYRDDLANPQGDAEAMDRYVARLVEMTGLPLREKIWWVRGPLLDQSGLTLYGLAPGSSESPPAALDRHELAHAVLCQHDYPDSDPPTFLMEGWAESQSGDSKVLASRALSQRRLFTVSKGRWARMSDVEQTEFLHTLLGPTGGQQLLTRRTDAGGIPSYLQEPTGPFWYHHDVGQVYPVGGAFVDFLIRRDGAHRFVELYFACRPGTFEASCQSIYNTDLDGLEKQFWDDLEQRIPPLPPLKSGTR
jgi:hypothetical protein